MFFTAYTRAIQALSTIFLPIVCKVRRCGQVGVNSVNRAVERIDLEILLESVCSTPSPPWGGGIVAAVSRLDSKPRQIQLLPWLWLTAWCPLPPCRVNNYDFYVS